MTSMRSMKRCLPLSRRHWEHKTCVHKGIHTNVASEETTLPAGYDMLYSQRKRHEWRIS